MLIETLIVSLLVGLFLKRSLNWLQRIEFQWSVVVIVAFLVETLLNFVCHRGTFEMVQWISRNTLYFQGVIYVLLTIFIVRNWRLPGILIMGIGILLNALVIFINGGWMPVDASMGQIYHFDHTLYELSHHLIFGHTVLSDLHKWPWLADIISVPPPYFWPKTISVGDLFIDFGVLCMVFFALFSKHDISNLQMEEVPMKQCQNTHLEG